MDIPLQSNARRAWAPPSWSFPHAFPKVYFVCVACHLILAWAKDVEGVYFLILFWEMQGLNSWRCSALWLMQYYKRRLLAHHRDQHVGDLQLSRTTTYGGALLSLCVQQATPPKASPGPKVVDLSSALSKDYIMPVWSVVVTCVWFMLML